MPPTRRLHEATPESLLVRLAIRGEEVAFEELVRRRQQWIRSLMYRFAGNSALADDLAQQVFLQAWRTMKQLREPDRFSGWLKQIAVNVWLQYIRRKDPLHSSDSIVDWDVPVEGGVGAGIDIDQALTKLHSDVRMCIVLSYHERMSHGEVSDATSLPLGTVKSHIRRGTDELRKLLSDYTDDIRGGICK